MSSLASIESFLCLLASLFLEFPGVFSVEIDHASAGEAVFLVKQVPEVNIWMGPKSISDRICTVVVTMNGARPHVVCCGLSGPIPLIDRLAVFAEEDIDSDLRFVDTKVFALRNKVFDIYVCGS